MQSFVVDGAEPAYEARVRVVLVMRLDFFGAAYFARSTLKFSPSNQHVGVASTVRLQSLFLGEFGMFRSILSHVFRVAFAAVAVASAVPLRAGVTLRAEFGCWLLFHMTT